MTCNHSNHLFKPSIVAEYTGYLRPSKPQRAKAAGYSDDSNFNDDDFPAPLVLPNDEIDSDPKYPAQTLSEWKQLLTPSILPYKRKKIFVAAPPGFTKECPELDKMQWPHTHPVPPRYEHVLKYLAAFYTGFDVVELPKDTLVFDNWSEGEDSNLNGCFVALKTPKESIRIRERPMTNNTRGFQLNLNDVLDAAIAVLPNDALALLLLMDFDMYEDDDDEFGCGRAYGYSHVCIVSSFRYNPALDKSIKLDRQHVWPASHCAEYVQAQVDRFIEASEQTPGSEAAIPAQPSKPLTKAIQAHSTANPSPTSTWLERVCRTASHELGHCLGMDHCMYYACIMQGSNSIPEDLRQPPYLCPVDNAKLDFLVAARGNKTKVGVWQRERALSRFVTGHSENGGGFAAFRAWLEARLAHGDTQISSYTEKQISEKMAAAKKRESQRTQKKQRVTSRDLNV
ncbi:unnamed protein product [Aureobasidium mustum]|uniref:Zincin n=1 Tax=Aureobasidium mustum TaxID=2773714 RepID=A0A9N8JW05_9PEZI|nr:unnamed protein product [Aureobasidium mustum]